MCSVRRLLVVLGVGVVLALAGCTSDGLAVSRANSSGVSVEAVPNSVEPGAPVTIRANCGDSKASATVSSRAFRTVDLKAMNGTLQAQVTINSNMQPGTFKVDVRCMNGSAASATASTTITVINKGTATPSPSSSQSVGPHTGGGFLANHGGRSAAQQSAQSQGWLIGGLTALLAATAVALTSARRRKAPIRIRRRR